MKKIKFLISLCFLLTHNSLSFGQGCTLTGPYTPSSPINWDGISNRTITNLEINNPNGHCIKLSNCNNITIQNCKLGPSLGEGVFLSNCTNITVTNCTMEKVESGVVADVGSGIKVINNDVKNVQGPMPRGQMVQFGNVSGTGNSISYNVGENILGESFPEDEISLYMCNGTPTDRIQVIGNWIRGGGPSTSGGGIMTGDMGGSYILVQDNILVNPGQYGITISSGHDITIRNNKIYSMQLPFSNIGLSAYKQYTIDTYSDTIMNNLVNFTNKDGVTNCLWNAGNCGTVIGWATNAHSSSLNASVLPSKIIGRAISVTTAIPDKKNSTIKVYPNPASDHLIVETTSDITNGKIAIYNISGAKIIEQATNGTTNQLNIRNLTLGVYIVKISNNDLLIDEKKIAVMR